MENSWGFCWGNYISTAFHRWEVTYAAGMLTPSRDVLLQRARLAAKVESFCGSGNCVRTCGCAVLHFDIAKDASLLPSKQEFIHQRFVVARDNLL